MTKKPNLIKKEDIEGNPDGVREIYDDGSIVLRHKKFGYYLPGSQSNGSAGRESPCLRKAFREIADQVSCEELCKIALQWVYSEDPRISLKAIDTIISFVQPKESKIEISSNPESVNQLIAKLFSVEPPKTDV